MGKRAKSVVVVPALERARPVGCPCCPAPKMSDFAELPNLPKFAGKSDDEICSMLFAHLQRRLQDSVAERKALHASARDAHGLGGTLMSELEKLQREHAELRRMHAKLGASFSSSQL